VSSRLGRADSSPPTLAERQLCHNLALASRILSVHGHDDFHQGQVSARTPGADELWIKRATIGFDEACPEDMIRAFLESGRPIDRAAPPELPLHQAVYAARPDVGAVVHSHAPHTLVFGATGLPLRPLSHDGACFFGRVGRFAETSQTVLSLTVGVAVARALGDGVAVLLENHGGLVVGPSLRQAVVLAIVLERACQLQLLAESTGQPYRVSSLVDVAGKQDYIYSSVSIKSYWDHAVRRIRREQSDVRQWSMRAPVDTAAEAP
jgi:L-fuculose-phosphate aldolase